ncbi:uncharacterized protein [Panulirus ornatus]|uniref:uncharacterized protein isoform X1 n=1 Tax=Panulirus ornatus TaxID=150431 RepID=UPI003A86BE8A
MPLVQKVWVSGLLEMFMVWSGPVIIPELTVSGTTTIDQTVNIRNPLEGSSANQSLEEYVAAVSELQTEVQLLKDALPTVLYHSGQQAITGFINAASLTVDNAHFDELTLHKVDDSWFMLVANDYDPEDFLDPYTVTSEVFAWKSFPESFTVVAEYVADHTTSGMFMTSNLPIKESFCTLAQLKVADHPHFEDNVKYTAGVLVYRYNKVTKNFEMFQHLTAYGVVDQAVLQCG